MKREEHPWLPELEQWDRLSETECAEVAETILRKVPPSFQYEKQEVFALGDQQHRMLLFTWMPSGSSQEAVRFVFLPGGQTTLGYDRMHPFVPTVAQAESWQDTVDRHYTDETLDVHLDRNMSPFRQVYISPLLLQVTSSDGDQPPVMIKGRLTPQRFAKFQEIRERVAAEGFRLPTSDEWEYACAAGSRTLFRWGNETPDMHAFIFHPDIQTWEKYLSKLRWTEYVKPNAFGLIIAQNSYHWECCLEREIMRGGDGGSAIHSGAGKFAEWLALATSAITKLSKNFLERGGVSSAYFRRVYPL